MSKRTYVAGNVPTLAEINDWIYGQALTAEIADGAVTAIKLAAQPAARVYHSVDQSILDATPTVLAFNSERLDTNGIHVTSAPDNTKLTCQTAGLYLVFANLEFEPNANGIRAVDIKLNGSTVIASETKQHTGASVGTRLNPVTLYQLAASDYLECSVYQDSGGTRAVRALSNYSPEFGMVRIGA